MTLHHERKIRAWHLGGASPIELSADEVKGAIEDEVRSMIARKLQESTTRAQLMPRKPRDDDGGGGGGGGGGGTGGTSSPWLATYRISWNDFSRIVELPCHPSGDDVILCPIDEFDSTLADADHIWLDERSGEKFGVGSSEVEIVLKSASSVTWWKEIKAFDAKGGTLGWIQTQDEAHGPVSMRFGAGIVDSIVFGKAKAFGVHTGMYQVLDVWSKRGKRLTFEWRND